MKARSWEEEVHAVHPNLLWANKIMTAGAGDAPNLSLRQLLQYPALWEAPTGDYRTDTPERMIAWGEAAVCRAALLGIRAALADAEAHHVNDPGQWATLDAATAEPVWESARTRIQNVLAEWFAAMTAVSGVRDLPEWDLAALEQVVDTQVKAIEAARRR